MKSFTDTVLMVRPANFGYNPETAVNNAFQLESKERDNEKIRQKAVSEFENMVSMMRTAGIAVHVWQDSQEPIKPDALFPNNWFSTGPNGSLITYPMFAENRRIERDPAIIDFIESLFVVKKRYTFEHYEEKNKFLEGTGSMLFDHAARQVFACLSPRTNIELLDKVAVLSGYEMIAFTAVDQNGIPVYHTNVMMALGLDDVIVCLESITNLEARERLINAFEASSRSICEISFKQVNAFAGNMIQLMNNQGEAVLVMSKQAHDSLTKTQLKQLSQRSSILAPDITTIETYGGGSARCMIAEIFLEKRVNNMV